MHLACDAFNENAVNRLRDLKNRDRKPFAIMFRNPDQLKPYAEISEQEEKSLISWRRPIVLLKKKNNSPGLLMAKSLMPA
ncbi:MAG: Sua5/YciO/YrdC/YwlC family protein [Bacteroidales bacterium]|nr:Sua5/YciO/YrdC/YwlC family protein [Bacteroidales bacterium]